jgi:hypothetical protein
VLAVCAAAGVNPRLPRPIASAAAERYAGHPPGTYTDTQFQKALDALSSLIVNSQPDDLLGIFHVSLLEDYFYKPERSENYPVNLPDAHRAIVDALRELAPADQHDPSNELHRYAMEWEPDHLWKCGRVDEIEKIVESLEARPLAKAADERERWQRWATALGEKLDKQSTAVVTARENLARWTGEAGNPTRAQAELTKLLPVRDQISGPDSEATIRTRGRIAYYTAKVGDMADASKLYGELWALCQGRLGDVHPTTLETWTDYARFTGEAGRPEHARKELRELLHICQNKSGETFGKDGTRTIAVAENLARFTGEAGFPRSARRQYARVLPFRQRASGPTDPDTLITRSNLAYFIGEAGEPGEACARYTELLPIREKTGKKHPDTLTTRANLARFMGEAGEPIAALKELTDLLALREKMAHQAHHPDTLTTWEILARLTAQLGRPATAVEALIGVLPRRARTSGDRHPDTIATRTNLACFTGMAAEPVGTYYDPEEAADELTEVSAMTNRQAADNPLLEPSMHTAELSVDVEKRTSAPEHPDTLTIRAPLAQMNALSRQPTAHMSGNEKLFETVERLKDLLSARVAASGKDHPDTLTTRENLAYFTGIAGNAAAAVDELTAVLRRRVRVLGPDHPATLVTRANIAYFTRAAGDVAAAVQQLSDLLQPRLRVSGQSHPDTLAVRRFLGHWADVATEPPRAWTPGASALPV